MSKRSRSPEPRRRPPKPQPTARPRGRSAEVLLLLALLALTVARTTLNEPPYRRAPLAEAGAYAGTPIAEQMYTPAQLLRVGHAAILLALAAVWAIGRAAQPRPAEIRHPLFGLGVVVLAGLLVASALGAADKREAFTTAAEQVSLLAAAFVMMQLARTAWRRRLVVIVLASVGVMCGTKALLQRYVELPQHIADFVAHKAERLASVGHQVGSPAARMFETRLREGTAKGWFSLANIFGSLTLLTGLTAAALVAEKWAHVRRRRREPPGVDRPDGPVQVPLPLLAAVATTLLALPAVAAWGLTESTGTILAGIVAALATVALTLASPWAGRHRRKLAGAATLAFLAGSAALVGVGVRRGGLPSRSLQVRWEYWSAAADMVADHPGLGVGPGNFADPYLRYRRPGAEEDVKNPHNVIVQAISEYGAAGGIVYLGLLAMALLKLCAPRASAQPDPADRPTSTRDVVGILAAVFAGAVGWRVLVTHYPSVLHLAYDNFVPVIALAVALPVCCWRGERLADGLNHPGRAAMVALACGVGGFALHNLSDFALFQPGAAMAFWVAAGALLAGRQGRSWAATRGPAVVVAAGLLAAVVVLVAAVVAPVWRQIARTRAAADAYIAGDLNGAVDAMRQATQADALDAGCPADLTYLLWQRARRQTDPTATQADLRAAEAAAATAARRDPARPAYAESHARARAYAMDPSLLLGAWLPTTTLSDDLRTKAAQWLVQAPGNPQLLTLNAHLAYLADDMLQAARLLQRAREVTIDTWPILLDHLGDVRHAAGQVEQAREAWRAFYASRHANRDAWRGLADATVKRLDRMNPQDPRQHLRLAELTWRLGCPDLTAREIAAARAADAALNDQSVVHLTPEEKRRLVLLAVKAQAVCPQGATTRRAAP